MPPTSPRPWPSASTPQRADRARGPETDNPVPGLVPRRARRPPRRARRPRPGAPRRRPAGQRLPPGRRRDHGRGGPGLRPPRHRRGHDRHGQDGAAGDRDQAADGGTLAQDEASARSSSACRGRRSTPAWSIRWSRSTTSRASCKPRDHGAWGRGLAGAAEPRLHRDRGLSPQDTCAKAARAPAAPGQSSLQQPAWPGARAVGTAAPRGSRHRALLRACAARIAATRPAPDTFCSERQREPEGTAGGGAGDDIGNRRAARWILFVSENRSCACRGGAHEMAPRPRGAHMGGRADREHGGGRACGQPGRRRLQRHGEREPRRSRHLSAIQWHRSAAVARSALLQGDSSSDQRDGDFSCFDQNHQETRRYDRIVAYRRTRSRWGPARRGAVTRSSTACSPDRGRPGAHGRVRVAREPGRKSRRSCSSRRCRASARRWAGSSTPRRTARPRPTSTPRSSRATCRTARPGAGRQRLAAGAPGHIWRRSSSTSRTCGAATRCATSSRTTWRTWIPPAEPSGAVRRTSPAASSAARRGPTACRCTSRR